MSFPTWFLLATSRQEENEKESFAAGPALRLATSHETCPFRGGPEPSSSMSQIVGAISRMADAAVTLVLGYYFGSSAGRDHSTGVEQENAH
jgi:hypothetical protein